MNELISYILVVTVLTVMPGADSMIVMKNTLVYQKSAGRMTVFGILAGHFLWIVVSILGLAVIITNSPLLFNIVKYMGAAYLIYIGVKSFMAKTLVSASYLDNAGDEETKSNGLRSSYMNGFISNILNPKVLIFYITILPQFVVQNSEVTEVFQLIILAGIMLVISMSWFLLVVETVNYMKRWLHKPGFQSMLGKGAGIIIILFGIRTALS
ncbi:LysE family translocator [Jeotgalicoccus halotolerans]|uniref:RhtB (Resistance to homoserine/threonine) family protein n=1 Tax=Jeotgalicoccus halotolerans TaxID=157227 RepID=A0A3E0AWY6_9STAP|nr:LysE family transporter [Jeotgalicoccus halotolerans]REG24241.1 RhtB (resistance to homoserine/threonine) family protein [Jeotgalicoccus halotolerans]